MLPMTKTETIKPPKCESAEATSHHTHEPGLGETHRKPAHHEVLDMGFDDGKPQELPGMEVDVVAADDCDLKDLMEAMTRDAKDEMSTANREILRVIRALGGDKQRYKRE